MKPGQHLYLTNPIGSRLPKLSIDETGLIINIFSRFGRNSFIAADTKDLGESTPGTWRKLKESGYIMPVSRKGDRFIVWKIRDETIERLNKTEVKDVVSV